MKDFSDLLSQAKEMQEKMKETQDIIKRSLTLLPLMMLARVDGKSPVEYIKNNNEKNKLRRIALDLIKIQNYDFNTFVNNL